MCRCCFSDSSAMCISAEFALVVVASARATLAAVTACMIDVPIKSVDIQHDATGLIPPSLLVAMMAPSEFSFRIRRQVNASSMMPAAHPLSSVAPVAASARIHRETSIETNKFTEYLVHEVSLVCVRIRL